MMRQTIPASLGFCILIATAFAAEPAANWRDGWPQWRGPLATGAAPNGDPPIHWDENTNLTWKVALPGKGSSTPIVWGDRIFLLTAADTKRQAKPVDIPKPEPRDDAKTTTPTTYHQFIVLCLDRQKGKTLWQQIATERVPHEGIQSSHSYAAASPTTDGKYVYASFGSHGIYCYDFDGKLQWKRELGKMLTRYAWGEAISPVIHEGTLIVNWDHEKGSFIVALDAKTGETRWKADRDEPTSWATPLVVPHKARTQVIVNGTNRVRSYDLKTGEVLWQCGGQTVNSIPSPVAADGVVYCMSGYRGALAVAVPLDARGELTDSDKLLWKATKGTPYVPSPLLTDGKLYYTQANTPLLTCLDAKTGKVLMDRERLPGLTSLYASPTAAKDRIYIVDRDGTTLVLKQNSKLEVLATNRLDDNVDASPVIVGKQLFLRGHRYLYCIEQK